jgi:hypothetical protein
MYSKERRLIKEIKKELAEGRCCQVFALYTQKVEPVNPPAAIWRDSRRRISLKLKKVCFTSTRRKDVCQKLVQSLAIAARPLAAQN